MMMHNQGKDASVVAVAVDGHECEDEDEEQEEKCNDQRGMFDCC